ncbi:membrane protein [Actinoplanes sp. SE50]|uniref:zf-HC2 domain-containing protein n=1 Tax=unclassified Actinoplanes TaxID=2626549 RepID=UPI00023EDCB7|nr:MULTISPECIES: zf-HC2 domain-containing protein [unclassified Actinoplanes]AEV89069.1 integral membrane protein [Actinoplanes sp. SE50/110]ATO87475.1 membrane protein [Actinoplanes sp. SE50]SLM04893.1 membrane protein [Actinoplanes sp. SE50/110]
MTGHPSPSVISRYADGDLSLDEATVWTVEVHLEECADCRTRLSGAVPADVLILLDRVSNGVDQGIASGPPPIPLRRRRWSAARHRWLVWHLLPWLGMTAAALGCAVVLQALAPTLPSLVLLLAPIAPLPGVAVAWSRGADPAWELIASTPAAGLPLLLRRTATVLAVIVPVLALISNGVGVSLALTLLPCLAFTTTAIALGAVLGVRLAAISLASAWVAIVAVPAVFVMHLPAILLPGSVAIWVSTIVVAAAFTLSPAIRSRRFSR